MTSVFIAVPYTRPHTGQFVESLIYTHKPEHIIYKQQPNYPIDISRNFLIDCWKLGKTDFLLMVDNDATWHSDALLRLMGHNLPVVCGCMYTRSMPPRPTMAKFAGRSKEGKRYYRFAETARQIIRYCYDHEVKEVKDNAYLFPQGKGDLHQVEGVGMHFTLIRRDVLETVKPPYFRIQGNTGAGEDFYFCEKVMQAGFQIYVDYSVHTGHCMGEENDVGLRELLTFAKYVDVDKVFTDDFQGVFTVG